MKKNRLVAKVKDIEVLAKSLTDETLSLANSVSAEAGSDWRTLSILLTPFLSSDEIKIIGITGSQGSGKTTFAQSLVTSLRSRKPLTVSLSLDDFYLSKTARGELAESVHPLLATRGVPGTHETDLLEKVLNQVASGGMPKEISVPTFDKARDDRGPNKSAYVGKLVLEGWCLGAAAQSVQDLREPINDLEREEDSSGEWRSWVNSQLQSRYHRLWQKVDFWIRLGGILGRLKQKKCTNNAPGGVDPRGGWIANLQELAGFGKKPACGPSQLHPARRGRRIH